MYLTSIQLYSGSESRPTYYFIKSSLKKLNEFKENWVIGKNYMPYEGWAATRILQFFIILNTLQDLTAMILELKEENMVRKILAFH